MKILKTTIYLLAISLLTYCSLKENKLPEIKKLLDKNQFKVAAEMASEEIQKDSSSAELYNIRGIAYLNLKNLDQSEEDFSKSILLDSTTYKAFYNRGRLFYEKQLYEKALIDYNTAISLQNKEADLYNNRGIAYFAIQDYESARKDFSKAVELDSTLEKAFINRASLERASGHFEEAILDYQRSLQITPSNSNTLYWLAITYFDLKNNKEGCELLKQAAEKGNEKARTEIKTRCNSLSIPLLK